MANANNVSELSSTASSNSSIASISILGTGLVSTADDAFRTYGSFFAKWWSDVGGVNTVAGTANAITITTPTLYAALKTGMLIGFKAGSANSGAATVNVDALGASAIRRQGDTALQANDILSGGKYLLCYDAAYNAAAGAWVLLNPSVSASGPTFLDNVFAVQNSADATKQAAIDVSGITTATKRTYIAPDAAGTLGLDGAGITTIASATTTNIGASKTRDVIISGVTTITAFDTVAAGTVRNVTASGAFLLTHNGTSLILPGGANLTTAAGDCFVAESLGSGNWRITSYVKADGTPLVANAQPIPTSGTWAVGTMALMRNTSGGSIADGATTGGANLNRLTFSAGNALTSGLAMTGTWKCVDGQAVASGAWGTFVRTA